MLGLVCLEDAQVLSEPQGLWPHAGWHLMSGKMAVLACMLEKLRPMGDRIVVVSNSTQVLDLVGALCRERNVSLAPVSPTRHA